MAEDQDPRNKKDWTWADFPVYRKTKDGTQFFKILNDELVLNIREDVIVSCVGVTTSPIGNAIEVILGFERCTEKEFNTALARVMDLLEPFFLDIMRSNG